MDNWLNPLCNLTGFCYKIAILWPLMYWAAFIVTLFGSLNLPVQTPAKWNSWSWSKRFASLGSFFILVISYISSGGSSKAMLTLSTHIMVAILIFGLCIFVYSWPYPMLHIDKFLAFFDANFTSILNPLIYAFRNKEMNMAIRRSCGQFVVNRRISEMTKVLESFVTDL